MLPSSPFAQILAKCRFRRVFLRQMSLSQGSAIFCFLFWIYFSCGFFCRRLFAKFFDLRSWLSVSLPLRSVGTLSPSPRESCFCKPRNNLEPCTASLELCRKSLASQEIRTKDIRFAVNSTKRNLDPAIVSQVYSQACHTAFILVRARG